MTEPTSLNLSYRDLQNFGRCMFDLSQAYTELRSAEMSAEGDDPDEYALEELAESHRMVALRLSSLLSWYKRELEADDGGPVDTDVERITADMRGHRRAARNIDRKLREMQT